MLCDGLKMVFQRLFYCVFISMKLKECQYRIEDLKQKYRATVCVCVCIFRLTCFLYIAKGF